MSARFAWGRLALLFFQLTTLSCTAQPASTAPTGVAAAPADFLKQQLLFPRVRGAQAAAGPKVEAQLRRYGIDPRRVEIFMRLIKTRVALEIWARNVGDERFQLLSAYPLAATSGNLGPKRQAGDAQVPEGFYEIDRFNPKSNYHLSLGLNYPNEADRALGDPNPGGDIFIHGGEVTIGCLPITDAGIEEVYWLAVLARAAGQTVLPVHIFPFPLTEEEFAKHENSPHMEFWRGLEPGYAHFEKTHQLTTPVQLAGAGH
jgi:murein L,D-transpeptidase YafK